MPVQQQISKQSDRPIALETALAEGSLDCVLTPKPLKGDAFESVAICEETVFLGVPAEHPIARGTNTSVEMLSGERLLTLGKGHRLFDHVQELCDASGAHMREDYEGTSLDALRQMVSIGMGFSLFPATYVAFEFAKEKNVVLREIDGWPIRRTICLAWRQGSVRREHFQSLASEAKTAFSALTENGSIRIVDEAKI